MPDVNRAQQPAKRPLVHRDPAGSERTAPDWEALAERLIREALEAGRFDDLPHHGQALLLEDCVHAGDMATANHLLRNANAVPPWIEADKQLRDLQARIEALLARAARSGTFSAARLGQELEALAVAHDAAVARLEILAPASRQHRSRLDRAGLRARLAAALDGAPIPR